MLDLIVEVIACIYVENQDLRIVQRPREDNKRFFTRKMYSV